MNTIYKAQKPQLPYIPPPDLSRPADNRKAERADGKNKLSFKSLYPPPPSKRTDGGVIEEITEILVGIFDGSRSTKEMKNEVAKFEELERKFEKELEKQETKGIRLNTNA